MIEVSLSVLEFSDFSSLLAIGDLWHACFYRRCGAEGSAIFPGASTEVDFERGLGKKFSYVRPRIGR